MKRITQRIEGQKRAGKKTLVGYITAGDPNLEESIAIAIALAQAGVDILEIGMPFSDPLADGPTIQKSAERALAAGTTLRAVFSAAQAIRREVNDLPMVLFTYVNPIFSMGYEAFAQEAKASGLDGALILDLPPEEADAYRMAMIAHDLDTIFLASPTTDPARLAWIGAHSRGFLYYVGRTGVTGVAPKLSDSLAQELAIARQHVSLPIMIGFGISTKEAAQEAAALGDGVVIGSAIVNIIATAHDHKARLKGIYDFITAIRTSLDQSHIGAELCPPQKP